MMIVKGEAYYCFTTKTNDSGKFPSHCYELGIKNPELVNASEEDEITLNAHVKAVETEHDKFTVFKIKNSKFPFKMCDMNNNKLEEAVALPNGTRIAATVDVKFNDTFGKEFLVCNAIKILDDLKDTTFDALANVQ